MKGNLLDAVLLWLVGSRQGPAVLVQRADYLMRQVLKKRQVHSCEQSRAAAQAI